MVKMSNDYPPMAFEIFTTADGSPTLSLQGGEKMHSLQGAFSETQYIYAPCVQWAMDMETPCLLSMGLGLGYNEMMAAALLIKNSKTSFYLASFESIPFLRIEFLKWLRGDSAELHTVYEKILNRTSKHYQIDPGSIKKTLLKSFQNNNFVLSECLPAENPFAFRFHSILYDAFSSDTDAKLWSEEHFLNFLDHFSAQNHCCFSTYAATGKLKRALKARQFEYLKKSGFGMKRESTLASRRL